MPIKALLYGADKSDREVGLGEVGIDRLSDEQLLWIDLVAPTPEEARQVATLLGCEPEVLAVGHNGGMRPRLVNYGERFRINAIAIEPDGAGRKFKPRPLTFVAGLNYVVSVHDDEIDFVDELRAREQGYSGIGALSSESFLASLLDWLLNSYFLALEHLVGEVDKVEVAILGEKKPSERPVTVEALVNARRRIAELRKVLISHRGMFYGLARPDFLATDRPDAQPHFDALNARLERVEDDVDHARELVVGAFDLLTTRTSQQTNEVMRALTFVTVLLGVLAFSAGVLGMNFDMPLFHTGATGFLVAVGAMVVGSLVSLLVAKWRKWI